MESLWRSYGIPMEILWNPYGTSWEQHASNTRSTRKQLACNTNAVPNYWCPYFQLRTLSLLAPWLAEVPGPGSTILSAPADQTTTGELAS